MSFDMMLEPEYCGRAKLCYMDTDSFIVYIKTNGCYLDVTKDVETKFGTSNCELKRSLPRRKSESIVGLMKDELNKKNNDRNYHIENKIIQFRREKMRKVQKSVS